MCRLSYLWLGAAVVLVGCARTAEERQLDEMREALTHVDENPSFGEKLTTKELAEIVKQQRPVTAGSDVPERHVMHFEDGTEEESDAPTETAGFEAADDPAPRPLLKVHGAPHASEVVEQTMPDENATAPAPQTTQPSAPDPAARKAYDPQRSRW